jgi:hypothetical protein
VSPVSGGPQSILGQQISRILAPGMELPEPLELLFGWIERNGLYADQPAGRAGFLSPQAESTDEDGLAGTYIEFAAEGDASLKYWFGREGEEIRSRLRVFCRTGSDGSMGAFWLDDEGRQRIVHMGSGSGSTLVCVLADDAVDFLRLLAIGYEEICWGGFEEPPDAPQAFSSGPNAPFAEWVVNSFGVSIPETGAGIVRHPSNMGDGESADPFWNWIEAQAMLS